MNDDAPATRDPHTPAPARPTPVPEGGTLLALDGYTPLPAGKIASVVTYLEMRARPASMPEPAPAGLVLRHVARPDAGWYRRIFRRIGEDWLWVSRLRMDEQALGAILDDPQVEVHALLREAGAPLDEAVGLLELDRRAMPDIELAFLGVVPELVGSGAGRFMMNRAMDLAWARGPRRVHVHTCTFDHQAAVGFYMRAGFTPVGRAIEVMDDPRLDGLMRPDAAPHAPMIRPR